MRKIQEGFRKSSSLQETFELSFITLKLGRPKEAFEKLIIKTKRTDTKYSQKSKYIRANLYYSEGTTLF